MCRIIARMSSMLFVARGLSLRPHWEYEWQRTELIRERTRVQFIKVTVEEHTRGVHRQEISNFDQTFDNNESFDQVHGTSAADGFPCRNCMLNFYMLPLSGTPGSDLIAQRVASYRNTTFVFVYEHEPAGYATRDCIHQFWPVAMRAYPHTLGAARRRQWSQLPQSERDTTRLLHGEHAFGACASINRPCTYGILLAHPISKIAAVYFLCQRDASHALCRIGVYNVSQIHLAKFASLHGNSLFQKLRDRSHRCKSFNAKGRCIDADGVEGDRADLETLLHNARRWFAVVGLVDRLDESLALFNYTFSAGFRFCDSLNSPAFQSYNRYSADRRQLAELTAKLMNNSKLVAALATDITIYKRFKLIFEEQLFMYEKLTHFKK